MMKLIGLDWDEATAVDIQSKGWYSQAQLEMEDGSYIPLNFWDPVRLRQELEDDFASGRQFFAEPNLIVLPLLTEESIRQAVSGLIANGFFDSNGRVAHSYRSRGNAGFTPLPIFVVPSLARVLLNRFCGDRGQSEPKWS